MVKHFQVTCLVTTSLLLSCIFAAQQQQQKPQFNATTVDQELILSNDTVEEGSGFFEDEIQSTMGTTPRGGGPSLVKTVTKRAADYYNGIVDAKFYWPFNAQSPTFPPQAVMGMGRPLQRAGQIPRTEYVVLWAPRGGSPHWGSVYLDQKLQVEGTFVDGNSMVNITSGKLTNTRLLQYVGTPSSNNFKFQWILARDVDLTTVIVQKQAGGQCTPRVAPAVFSDSGYEFLGEADIDSRVMRYVYNSQVHVVDSSHFINQVYLLTKQRCSCSCN